MKSSKISIPSIGNIIGGSILILIVGLQVYGHFEQKRITALFADKKNYEVAPAQVLKFKRIRNGCFYLIRFKSDTNTIETKLHLTGEVLTVGSTVMIQYLKNDVYKVVLADTPGNPRDISFEDAVLPKFLRSLF